MTHTLSRALGVAVLTASLATVGTAAAVERPALPRAHPEPSYRAVESAAEPGVTSLAQPRRSIWTEVVWRGNRLYLRGDVESYTRGQVRVQRRACESCQWRRHDTVRAGKRGRFRSVIGAPEHGSTFWRATVASSDGYARSYSATWETYY